ncbi:unnamed protein product [Anisakis simplex]|uniref:PhoU domain-containing protein n=1 Tax=Anisakis simplex TaxID=6269 RepID=A0A0M3KFH7_ANISI|nr:unnamed protein product [Anisakis simplex]
MIIRGRDFMNETTNTQRRLKAIEAARELLKAVARLLIMADMVDVHLILMNIARAKSALDSMQVAESKQELAERYSALKAELEELNETTRRRVSNLRELSEQDDLQAARAWLKVNSTLMYTSSIAYIRHPEVDQIRLNRDFAHSEMSKALQAIAEVLEGRNRSGDIGLSHLGRIGDLIHELDQFQNRVYMEPSAYRAHIHRPELEELLERIVSGAAVIADSENTRDDRKKKIVDECNNLRQALQDLLNEYEKNAGRYDGSEELDLAMVHLGHKTKDLKRHLRRAIVDHISDAFLDTMTPLMMLIDSAKKHDQPATIHNGKLFYEHAQKLVQVANLACQMSNNEDGVRIVRFAAIQVEKLAPQV